MESTSIAEPVRIILIGLREGFARSVARYLGGERRVVLTGVASQLAPGSLALHINNPELALLEWSVLGESPRDTVRMLRQDCSGLRIVGMLNEVEPYRAIAALSGIDSLIAKDRIAADFNALLIDLFPRRFDSPGDRNE